MHACPRLRSDHRPVPCLVSRIRRCSCVASSDEMRQTQPTLQRTTARYILQSVARVAEVDVDSITRILSSRIYTGESFLNHRTSSSGAIILIRIVATRAYGMSEITLRRARIRCVVSFSSTLPRAHCGRFILFVREHYPPKPNVPRDPFSRWLSWRSNFVAVVVNNDGDWKNGFYGSEARIRKCVD